MPASPRPTDTESGGAKEEVKEEKPSKNKGSRRQKRASDPTELSTKSVSERGQDLSSQILKKKQECSELITQLRTLNFGSGLASELERFQQIFEYGTQFWACGW